MASGCTGQLAGSTGPGAPDSIRFGVGAAGLDRAEVRLTGVAFEPHRHDTYAIGITTSGVQRFRYRGGSHVCLPGQWHVLHPDELHDGAAGTEDGFGYRILYVAPELLREALDHSSLPFVEDPVQGANPETQNLSGVLEDMDEPVSDLGRVEVATAVADALRSFGGRQPRPRGLIDERAVEAAREYLAAHAHEPTSASTLERLTGTDRFTLARHFRRALGTSPDRYRTMRRLERAREQIERGVPLAQVAAGCGFADQSHMTRQFKRAFGFTPTRWTAMTNAGGS